MRLLRVLRSQTIFSAVTPPDFIDIVPERVFPPVARPARASRLSHVLADGLASLLLNGLVIGFLGHIGWPARTARPESAGISVELVDSIPGQPGSPGKSGGHGPRSPAKADTKPEQPPQAEAPPASSEARSASPMETTQASVQQTPAPPRSATPAPLEHPTDNPQPHLVAAPPDPHQAATQVEKNVVAVTPSPAVEIPKPIPPTPAPPQRPAVLSSREESDQAPPPESKPKAEKPQPTAEQKRQAENTAKLAAALPFGQTFMSAPLQASLSGTGTASAEDYRGSVYGAFKKADAIVEQARARHLSGQTVVAFSIDDTGALVHVGVAVSSGNAEVDETAVEIIRRSAPFPPPPPGAQHSFSPAIGLGLDR